MTLSNDYVKLEYAKLCCNCNIIFERNICPLCSSGASWLLVSKVLDQKAVCSG